MLGNCKKLHGGSFDFTMKNFRGQLPATFSKVTAKTCRSLVEKITKQEEKYWKEDEKSYEESECSVDAIN